VVLVRLWFGPICGLNVGQRVEIEVGGENGEFHLSGQGGKHDIDLGRTRACAAQLDNAVWDFP